MPGPLSDNIRAILAGAPELVHTPTLTTGLAQGVTSPQTPAGVDPQAVGQAASFGMSATAQDQFNANLAALKARPLPGPGLEAKSGGSGWSLNPLHDVAKAAGDVASDVGAVAHAAVHDVAEPALKALNYPLATVQHVYRAEHDMWTRYGVLGFLKDNALVVPGTVDKHLDHQLDQSWKITGSGGDGVSSYATNNPNYRDVHGNVGSPGYDLVNLVHHVLGGAPYTPNGWHRDDKGVMQPNMVLDPVSGKMMPAGGVDWETGLVNGVFDLSLDPVLKIGKGVKYIADNGLALGGEKVVLSSDAATRTQQIQKVVDSGLPMQMTADSKKIFVGGRVLSAGRIPRMLIDGDGNRASNIPMLATYNSGVRAAFDRLAGLSDQEIIKQYPALRPLAADLGDANTIGEVSDVFEQALTRHNFGFLDHGLPTTSVTRRLLSKTNIDPQTPAGVVSDLLDKSAASGHALLRAPHRLASYRPFTIDPKTMGISGHEIDPDGVDGLGAIRSTILISQTRKVANAVVADYARAPDAGTRINILTHAFRDMLVAAGVPETDPLIVKYGRDINFLVRNSQRQVYGVGDDLYGDATRDWAPVFTRDPQTDEPINLGLWSNQTGKIALPQFNEVRSAVAAARGGLRGKAVHMDDWLYSHYTTSIFKPLALLSLGFALRVASGELIPAILQNSAKETFGSNLMAAAARLNPTIRDLSDELGADSLKGIHAQVEVADAAGDLRTRTGRVVAVDPENETLTVRHLDPDTGRATQSEHSYGQVTLLHEKITDKQILDAANGMGIPVTEGEVPHVRAALGRALFGVGRRLVDPDYFDTALRTILINDGHTVAPGLSSNHDVYLSGAGPAEDVREQLSQAHARIPDKAQHLTDEFRLYDAGDDSHPMYWNHAISEAAKDASGGVGARAYRAAIAAGASREDATKAFVEADHDWMVNGQGDEVDRFRSMMALYGQHSRQLARLRADAMRGLIYGRDGGLNSDVLDALSGEADTPTIASLAEREPALRPRVVKGRVMEPIPVKNPLKRVSDWGWRRAIHPTINSLSRQPIYTMLTTQEFKMFKPWIDAGLMDPMEAHHLAMVRAANRMLPLIHNTLLRSQASDMFRNFVPFYFAQEQAYRRYGRVILHDPVAFRKALLGFHAISNSGAVRADANGNNSVVLPGAGELAQLIGGGAQGVGLPVLGGIPSVVSGDTISLKTVVPEGNLPSVSPLYAVPAKAIARMFPSTEPFVAKTIGGVDMSESMIDQLIPNSTIRRVLQATPFLDREAAFQTAYLNNIAWAKHESDIYNAQAAKAFAAGNTTAAQKLSNKANGFLPGPNANPDDQQKALDRIKHATRIQMMIKAAVGAVSPLSPVLDTGDVKLRKQLQEYITADGIGAGIQKFLAENPTATADTVFHSDNSATGTALPATQAALDWMNQNRSWVRANPLAAAYLIPQTKQPFDVEAYNQELAIGLRNKLPAAGNSAEPAAPHTFLSALYAAATDPEYYTSLTEYENARTALANDSAGLSQLDAKWVAYKQGLASANPVWWASHNQGDKVNVATQALTQLSTALRNSKTPYSPQNVVATTLVKAYGQYQDAQTAIRTGQTTESLSTLSDQFNAYLDAFVKQDPAASAMVTGIFRRLVNAR